MKFFHNDKVSLAWAIFVEIAVHALFAFQAFLLGGFLGELALSVVFGAAGIVIGAWALAIFIFGAAFQAFVFGEYMREHVESFESTAKGNGSYIRSWKEVRWLVAGIEMASLVFRCYTVIVEGHWIQAIIIFILGVIALRYAFAQAKIIHASVNRPATYEISQSRNAVGRDLAVQSTKMTRFMTADEKRRYYRGDLSAVDAAENRRKTRIDGKLRAKDEKRTRETQRLDEQRREYEIAEEYERRILGDPEPFLKAVPTDQADGNGRSA